MKNDFIASRDDPVTRILFVFLLATVLACFGLLVTLLVRENKSGKESQNAYQSQPVRVNLAMAHKMTIPVSLQNVVDKKEFLALKTEMFDILGDLLADHSPQPSIGASGILELVSMPLNRHVEKLGQIVDAYYPDVPDKVVVIRQVGKKHFQLFLATCDLSGPTVNTCEPGVGGCKKYHVYKISA